MRGWGNERNSVVLKCFCYYYVVEPCPSLFVHIKFQSNMLLGFGDLFKESFSQPEKEKQRREVRKKAHTIYEYFRLSHVRL